jgi:hypothetical protein
MAGAGLAQLGRVDALLDREAQMIAAERLALRRQENGHVVRLDSKLRTALPDVLLKPCYRPLADGHIAVLVTLALADQDQATVERLRSYSFSSTAPCGAFRSSTALPGWRGRAADWLLDLAQLHDALDLLQRRRCSWAGRGPAGASSISDAGLCRM